ncbi:MAG TPA: hypothetical protein VN493_29980 [Thermoanaerobaculia bacterium]|nr:hypothetical protein [Thermoanaerobaculia bacterium]
MSSTRVNLVSLLALLFLVLVLAVTPEARQLVGRLAFWAEGVEEKIEESRRERKAAAEKEESQEGRSGEETAQAPQPPPHVVVGPDGNFFPEPGYKWVNEEPGDQRVEWCAGCEHPEHPHVIASTAPDQWRPAPGYEWAEAKGVNDMRVVWVPGRQHSDHEHVVAADKEGEWRPAEDYNWVNEDPHDLSVVRRATTEPVEYFGTDSVTPPG